jgi:uncharacterized membrane protein
MSVYKFIPLGIFLLTLALAAFVYPLLPMELGAVSRFNGVFFIPMLSLGMYATFLMIPIIDPLKHNVEKIINNYFKFVTLVSMFLFYLFVLSITWSLGYQFSVIAAVAPAFGALFFYCGVLTENAEQNSFLDIQTPWTKNDRKAWESTHTLGGKMFKISAIIAAAGFLVNSYAVFFVMVPFIFSSLYLIVHSYNEHTIRKAPAKRGKKK